MSTWTDDELGELLRATLHDHEDPGDADRALRTARPVVHAVRRPRLLPAIAAVAAGIVVVGGVAAVVRYAGQGGNASSASAAGGVVAARAEVTGTPIGAQVRTMRTYGALPEGTPGPRPVTTVISDPSRLSALVRLVDGLQPTGPSGRGPCPPTTLQPGYTTLVLRTSDGTWRFTEYDGCPDQVGVDRDGHPDGALDDTGFLDGVEAVVEAVVE